ncbi:MAG: tyrosine-type recombinase/integrase, partial [Tepidisphaeraceae bacterium]
MKSNKTTYKIEKGLRLFKTTYKDKKGAKHLSGNWWIEFRDHDRQTRRMPAFTDQQQSIDLAKRLKRLVAWKISNTHPDPDTERWIETMPADMREILSRWGILDGRRMAAGKPLAEHIDNWKAALLAKGNTVRHAELVTGRVRAAFKGTGFMFWSDITATGLAQWLADERADWTKADGNTARGIGAQTSNFYLQACKSFCKWVVRNRMASSSPVDYLEGLNVKTDRRQDRRALSAEELQRLIDAAKAGPELHGMTGAERAVVYQLAAETGFRAGEIRSLLRLNFKLDGDKPVVTIKAGYAKGRREDTLPLRPATAALLKAHLAGKMPLALAFNVPIRQRVAEIFRTDLAAARQTWLAGFQNAQERDKAAEGTFLAYRDGDDHKADFHALRHTFISNLVAGGVHPKTAQRLARHSVITLTMDRYCHALHGTDL